MGTEEGDKIYNLDGCGQDNLKYYDEDLTNHGIAHLDIVTVAEVYSMKTVLDAIRNGIPVESISGFKIIYQRKSEEITKTKQVICDLQQQLKEAEERLAKLA